MTIQHHPSEAFLLDYATGAMSEAWCLAVATHLAMCPRCREEVEELEALGGAMLMGMDTMGISSALSEHNAQALSDVPQDLPTHHSAIDGTDRPTIPEPLRGYLGGDLADLKWQRFGVGAAQIIVPTGDPNCTARLLRIPAGKPVPQHSHNGLEFTLVLTGSFSDHVGEFGPGDIQEADGDLLHQPRAGAEEDCVCLAITDAPLRFSGLAARLVQPFIGI